MKEIIKIAWRNLWRNKKRTLITASSIFFAIFFAILMRSFQLGSYDHMIRQSIESYSGYIQVQNPDYLDDPTIDNSIVVSAELIEKIKNTENVKIAVPRIESFALASTGTLSKGVLVSGISPELEKKFSNPYHRLVRYRFSEVAIKELENKKDIPTEIYEKIKNNREESFSSEAGIILILGLSKKEAKEYLSLITECSRIEATYLTENDNGILVSDKLAKYLKVEVGDTVTLMGQGYQGVSAAGIFPVRGIVKIPSPDLDNKLIYMPISTAATLFGMGERLTSIAINLNDTDDMLYTRKQLSKLVSTGEYAVLNWEAIMPLLKQQIKGDSDSGKIFLAIIYLIVFFGVYGTVMMMISERMREFGVMVAIGMKQRKLAMIVTIEMIFLGAIGAISGMIATVPIVLYGYHFPIRMTGDLAKMYEDMGFDPVLPLAAFDPYFFIQGFVVFVMVLLACYVPGRTILKINVIKAIHGN